MGNTHFTVFIIAVASFGILTSNEFPNWARFIFGLILIIDIWLCSIFDKDYANVATGEGYKDGK